MKILVGVKEVGDPAIPVHVGSAGETLEYATEAGVINPFDEIALEEAILLKERKLASEVVAIAVGPEAWQGTLRTALALGADRAVLVPVEKPANPVTVARALANYARSSNCNLILLGRQGVDMDHGVTAAMTAGILGWPQATCVSQIAWQDGCALVTREVEGGQERLKLPLPAVISCDLGLNTPRHVSLPNIMKTRSKAIEHCPLEADPSPPAWQIIGYLAPPQRPLGQRVSSVDALFDHLVRAGVL
ncbi:MAG: electron transfer flavoprotein subunit beta/FixA family protein [Magnetococcales bacterium]|nr:electron transfer flavoprotein subunit beta/FixA family protein [Magnetococcales bacterium]